MDETWHPTTYRTHTLGDIQRKGADLVGQEVTVAGFLHASRGKGAICFADLRDGTGMTRSLPKPTRSVRINSPPPRLTRESTLTVTGTVAQKRPPKTKEGEAPPPPAYEVLASSISVIAEAEAPLPLGVTDTVGVGLDTRLDNRFLDLRRAHVNAMFRLRTKVLQYGREHLITEGFIETHTPKIVATATEGGTDLFPMMYFDTPAFLNQSPQLFKQLCMSGGLERVFEIGPAFRAEKHDTYRHLNEFISFDIESSGRPMTTSWASSSACCTTSGHRSQTMPPARPHPSHQRLAGKPRRGAHRSHRSRAAFPSRRIRRCHRIIKERGGSIEWGDDIDAENSDCSPKGCRNSTSSRAGRWT